MSNRITLDQGSPFDVATQRSSEDILKELQNDQQYQRERQSLNRAGLINSEITEEIIAALWDLQGLSYDTSENSRFINWETTDINYKVLRRAGEIEAARLIKNKRRLDFSQYGKPPKQDGIQRGAQLIFKNPDYSPTKEEKVRLRQWELDLFSGFFFAANDPDPNFAKFIGNAYEDFFDLDDITKEIRRDGLDKPLAVHLQDPMLYKPVIKQRKYTRTIDHQEDIWKDLIENWDEMNLGKQKNEEKEEPDYILIQDGHRFCGVTRHIVQKHHFFTRSDYRKTQRGFGIVEQALNILSWLWDSLKMNSANFTNKRLPKGLLAFTGGGIGPLNLEKLRKILFAHMNGISNDHRFPMVNVNGEKGDVKWVGIGGTSREMEYHLWVTLLFSILCMLSGTDPRELALGAYSDVVKKSSLNSEKTDGLINESKDLGAKTFLSHLQDSLNTTNEDGRNIFQEVTQMDIELQFVGFEVEDKKLKLDITKSELEVTGTLNELLAKEDKELATIMYGGENIYDVVAPNNKLIIQALQSKEQQANQQAKAQQQAGPQPGAEGQQGQGQEEEQQYTDADKRLLEKYGGENGQNINEELKKELA